MECPICFEPNPPVVTKCGHRYCEVCLRQSLMSQRRCPSCRMPLRNRDIVHTLAGPDALGTYLEFLLQLLMSRTRGKGLVVTSWGNNHERLTSTFRKRGLRSCWAWRGGSKQLIWNLNNFMSSSSGILFLDPGSEDFPLSWAHFQDVTDVYVMWPLCDSPDNRESTCCQMRRVMAAAPGAKFTLVTRDESARLPVAPDCVRTHLPGLECPICTLSGEAR